MVRIYFGDQLPPHFHARYVGHAAKVDIDTLALIDGHLPGRALGLATEWAALHQSELREAFDRAANFQQPGKIAPLP